MPPADVGDFGVEFAGIVGLQQPAQGRLEDRVAGERRKQRLAGQSEAQHAIHFDDGLGERRLLIVLRVVAAGNVSAAHDLAFDDFLLVGTLHQEVDGLAFVERKQQLLRDGIVAVILFQHLQRATGRIAQDDGIRLQMRGNAGKLRMVYTRLEIERHILARHKEILVVDGECGLVAAVGSLLLSLLLPTSTPHSKSRVEINLISSSFFIVVSPCFRMNAFSGREGGGFPVLWEERGMRGNLQGVFNHGGHRGHGGNRR